MLDGKYAQGPRARVRGEEFVALTSEKGDDFVRLGLPRDAGPRPGFTWSNRHLSYIADVPLSEVEELYTTSWEFQWRGRPFVLQEVKNGVLLGGLKRPNDKWATENGLTVIDRGWAVGQFNVDEVENLREIRTDHLAERREGERE